MQASSAPLTRSSQRAGPSWGAIVLLIALGRPLSAQSPSSSGSGEPPSQSKQEKKDQKTQAKARKAASKADASDKEKKKTTSSQDAAYALAYKAGIPKQ